MVESALLLPCAAMGLGYGDGGATPLALAAALSLAAGLILNLFKPRTSNLRAREGFACVALIWVALSLFGALPFYTGGYVPTYVDAFFECVSGFTTTGASILPNVEALPKSVLFWRSLTHLVGGMGVLVLSLALMPRLSENAMQLLKAESTGPAPGKLVPRMGQSAKLLYGIYLALTLVEVIVLCICGLDLYDALIHAFGSAGTGGFSNYALSVGQFQSPAVDAVIAVSMLLFGVNFSLFYLLLQRNFKAVFQNSELRAYLLIVFLSVAAIAVNILPQVQNVGRALQQSFFQVSSIITTTGYATTDFDKWPQLSRMILVVLMLIGACAGSTGGGMKVVRVNLLMKSARREVRRTLHPRGVSVIKNDGRSVSESSLSQTLVFFFLYMLIICIETLIVSLDGFSLETNLTATISAISNIGPGLGLVGPMGNFFSFSPLSKVTLSLCMLIGRLEIYPILLLFTPAAWDKRA